MAVLILVNGEEDFLKERSARYLASTSLTGSVSEFTMPAGLKDFHEEASLVPLDGNPRSFILWNVSELPAVPPGDDVVVAVSAGKKVLDSPGAKRILSFPKLKSYDDNNEVVKWILKEGEDLNIDLSRIAGALFVNSGNNLRKIASEIRKLSIVTPPGGTVSPEQARSVICFSAELSPKSIVDAVCEGQTVRALTFFDKLQELGDETGWIIAYMQRHVVQMLRLESMVASGVPDVAERLGLHPFLYRKMLLPRLGLWSSASLASSLDVLCDLDVRGKLGGQLVHFGLEAEIVRLSEEARNGKRR